MDPTAREAGLLLPEGTRLLHIGPHKTGTTSLQAALFAARREMLAQGVRHAGRSRNPASAVRAVTGRPSAYSDDVPPPISQWRSLVREIRSAREPRVVLSSEFFAWAKPDAIRRIVEDLDPARVHVAVTLRPLGRIMPSQWQQNVQAGILASFDGWLDGLFNRPDGKGGTAFWTLHRHDQLIARWAEVVGSKRVTVVVADDRDHAVVLRAFEQLIGLREGTLVEDPDRANRSLTLPEIEAIRAFNKVYKAEGPGKARYAQVMRFGAAQLMKLRQPAVDEPKVEMPQWALDRAGEIGREMVDRIAASGVRVIGDLELLTRVQVSRLDGDRLPAVQVSPQVAASMAMGILVATGAARRGAKSSRSFSFAEPTELARVPTYQVIGVVGMRARGAAAARGRGAIRFLRPTQDRLPEPAVRRRPLPTHDPASDSPVLLPEGTLLLHIGPPKTGTTALQGAFHVAREATADQGVHYAGGARHSISAVLAVTGRPSFFEEGEPPPIGQWRALVRDVGKARQPRVVISSEFFADAEPDAIRTVVRDLDPSRVHVVVTLRPLARILPSQWQQYVQSGMRVSFDEWLDAMLNQPPGTLTPTFWRRHRHDQLVARWAEVVGPRNMTVIALDDRDHGMVLRVFEQLTGLREGTLVAPPDLVNRSMTMPEIEAVRAFNIAFKAEGLGKALLSRVMHFGAAQYMRLREPDPAEPRVETPQWAVDRAGEIAREMVDSIAASGVRVIGDLEAMARLVPGGPAGDCQPPVQVPPQIAATMAMGVLISTGRAGQSRMTGKGKDAWGASSGLLPVASEPIEVMRVPTCRLLGVLAGRGRRAVAVRVASVLRRVG